MKTTKKTSSSTIAKIVNFERVNPRTEKQIQEKRVSVRQRINERITFEPRMNHAENLIKKAIRFLETKNFTFSATDRQDINQAGLLGLVEIGFFENTAPNSNAWRAVMRAIESRDCMRLNCKREKCIGTYDDVINSMSKLDGENHSYSKDMKILVTTPLDGFLTEESEFFSELGAINEHSGKISPSCLATLKTIFQALREIQKIDTSRKSKSNHKAHRDFLANCIAFSHGKNFERKVSAANFRKRKQRFLDYLSSGLQSLRESPSLENLEILILSHLEKSLLT